jgi:predicted enzyme related to lactoylglutathione lyase
MTVLRMDNVGIVFEDLDAAVAFFTELGLELEGRSMVEGRWAERVVALDDIDDTITRLQSHGAELVGEVAQYEDINRLCYLRGPEGIIVALAEQLR